jgi:L-methionine (R)-S-oxide reductase
VPCDATAILQHLSGAALSSGDRDSLAKALVDVLRQTYPQASWVGVYWLEGNELVLGPYVGPPTEHTRIPVGKGVCGTAIAEGADQLVPDVRERANYLACSAKVRSEVVVLIRARGQVVGQIDMDSEKVDGFSGDDACVLKAVADSFGGLLASLEVEREEPR